MGKPKKKIEKAYTTPKYESVLQNAQFVEYYKVCFPNSIYKYEHI